MTQALKAAQVDTTAINSQYSFRNRFINGDLRVDQRNSGNAATITAGAALAYPIDRFYAYCTGANITGQQVAGNTTTGLLNVYQFTGAASNTGFGFGQRIMRVNSYDLAGHTCNLSVVLASSTLTSITWTAYYANSNDTFGTLASPTKTQIATGTFTINSTLNRYNANISVPVAATTGIDIVLTGGALLGSQTVSIGGLQFEQGIIFTGMELPPYEECERRCMKYFETLNGALSSTVITSNQQRTAWQFKTRKRISPTMSIASLSGSVEITNIDFVQVLSSTGANASIGSGSTADAESYT